VRKQSRVVWRVIVILNLDLNACRRRRRRFVGTVADVDEEAAILVLR
jgi:hypothetical protein